MGRRRANAYSEDNPFSGDSAANEFSTPEERQQPVTTRPRGGEVDRGAGDPGGLDLSVDTDPSDDHVPMETPMASRRVSARPAHHDDDTCALTGDHRFYWCDGCGGDVIEREDGIVGGPGHVISTYCRGNGPDGHVMSEPTGHTAPCASMRTARRKQAGEKFDAKVRCPECGLTKDVEVDEDYPETTFHCPNDGTRMTSTASRSRIVTEGDRRRAFIEPGNQDRVPDVGNNPSHDPSEPRAEDRWQERAGQNYDTLWRGQRDEPYYDPLDPVYPRPGDEPDNVAEYAEDTGVEPADPQAAPAAPRPDKSAKVSIRCATCGQQGKIALEKVSTKTRCKCGSPFIDFTDRIAKAQRRSKKERKWYVIDGTVDGPSTVLGPYASREAAESVIEAGGTAWDGLSSDARVKSLWTDEGGNIHGDPASIFGSHKANGE